MVNTPKNRSAYKGQPPNDGEARKITPAPIYPPKQVIDLLEKYGSRAIVFITTKCRQDIKVRSLDQGKVAGIIRAQLSLVTHHKSEWCVEHPGSQWSACDAYRFDYPSPDNPEKLKLYIKFAINGSRKMVLVYSCHLDERR